jgi:hypothetical protein
MTASAGAGADAYDEGETYMDVVQGRVRKKRGPRTNLRRGPYSREEARMIDAFDKLLAAERKMHGEIAQPTCVDITVLLVQLRAACEEYSYERYRDVSGLDPHVVFDAAQLDVPADAGDDLDVGDLRLCALLRVRTCEKIQTIFCLLFA